MVVNMKKGDMVVCKNCGTRFVFGRKQKLSGTQNFVSYLFLFLCLFCILFIIPIISLLNIKKGVACPACGSRKLIPVNTPIAKRLNNFDESIG